MIRRLFDRVGRRTLTTSSPGATDDALDAQITAAFQRFADHEVPTPSTYDIDQGLQDVKARAQETHPGQSLISTLIAALRTVSVTSPLRSKAKKNDHGVTAAPERSLSDVLVTLLIDAAHMMIRFGERISKR